MHMVMRGPKGSFTSGFFFFQAEDGIRDLTVTGVQTCALPIYAVVLTVANEQAPLRIEGQGVRAIEFAKARSFFAPGLKELAVRIEFQDARVVGRFLAVAIGHEDIAIESDRDFGWLVEGIQAGSGDAGLPKVHQNLAVLIEFKHLLPLAVLQPVVGNPQISVVVHANLVRADEQALTKTLEKFPGGLEFEDGIEWGI